jgi:hypothetical protein
MCLVFLLLLLLTGECGRKKLGWPNWSQQVGWNVAPTIYFRFWCSHSLSSCCYTSFFSSILNLTNKLTIHFTIIIIPHLNNSMFSYHSTYYFVWFRHSWDRLGRYFRNLNVVITLMEVLFVILFNGVFQIC